MTDINTHLETFKTAIRAAMVRISNQRIQEISRFERELAELGYQDGPDWRALDSWKSMMPPAMSHISAGDKWGMCLYKTENGKSIVAHAYVGAVDADGKVYKIKGNKPKPRVSRIEYPIKGFVPACSITDATAVEDMIHTALLAVGHQTVNFKPHHPNNPVVDRRPWLVVGTVLKIDGKEWTIHSIRDGNGPNGFDRWAEQYVGVDRQDSPHIRSSSHSRLQGIMKAVAEGRVEVVKIGGAA